VKILTAKLRESKLVERKKMTVSRERKKERNATRACTLCQFFLI